MKFTTSFITVVVSLYSVTYIMQIEVIESVTECEDIEYVEVSSILANDLLKSHRILDTHYPIEEAQLKN